MYSNAELFAHVVAFGFLFIIVGLTFGFLWGQTSSDKKREAEEQKEKQQKMWNDYLEALKGGKYERK